MSLTAHFHTFGCKLNFAETSTIARSLAARGVLRVQRGDRPDMVVVNTCSVTELADKKCRQAIRGFGRRWPGVPVIVTGCYAQLQPEQVAGLPGVAIVAGNDRKDLIESYIDTLLDTGEGGCHVTPAKEIRRFTPSCDSGDRTRFFLKVQDGCDYFCSYCTIPYARGRSRSPRVAEIVAQARDAVARGATEIVLTGVNTGDFGRGTDETFTHLVRALDAVEGLSRIRVSSIEPNLLTDELIELMAASRLFMPHFHLPLQAGDDDVLRLMRRRYDTALFAAKVAKIRSCVPDAFIGVDLMVGARGETDERFENSRRFVESLDISRLHVFPYSERPGTAALLMTGEYVVPQEEKHRRANVMLRLSEAKLDAFARRFEGTERPVLFEHTPHRAADGTKLITGLTDNYLRVSVPYDASLINTIAPVRLTESIMSLE